MKFSVFSVSMPEYNVEDTVKTLKELGYDGVEWRVTNPPPEKKPDNYSFERRYWSYNLSNIDVNRVDEIIADVKSLCDAADLEISALASYLDVFQEELVEKVMKAGNIIGCRNIRVNVPLYDEKENYRILFDKTVKQTEKMVKLAEKYDVRINFETHMGNIVPSASAVYRLVSNFDPRYVGVIFDPGNMVYEGFENYRFGIELLGEYLAHVHIKNAKWYMSEVQEDGTEVWLPDQAPFKKGIADIKRLMRILKDVNYNGYISVEDFSNEEDTYTKLKNNIQYLKQIYNSL